VSKEAEKTLFSCTENIMIPFFVGSKDFENDDQLDWRLIQTEVHEARGGSTKCDTFHR
jgi:hypothetical protein